MKTILKIACFALLVMVGSSCKEFLDVKPSSKLAVPHTLKDLQALLDHPTGFTSSDGGLSGESSATEYYLLKTDFEALQGFERNLYSWANADVFAATSNDWSSLYKHIFTSNVILENLRGIERNPTNAAEWDNVKGQAHFVRAKLMFTAAQIWCLVYNDSYANTEPGVVIREDSDFNKVSKRSTLKETFDYIVADAMAASNLLAGKESFLTRGNGAAAYALLARIQLYMGNAAAALRAAEKALTVKSDLLDYSTLSTTPTYPITLLNKEVLFHHSMVVPGTMTNAKLRVNRELYDTYQNGDLRKILYFRTNTEGTIGFRGSYTGASGYFSGIATDEVYLIRAEAYARQGNLDAAMRDLNTLLVNRWKKDVLTGKTLYVNQSALDKDDALSKILSERRKELVFRGIRWGDIKRLNRDGINITLQREVNGLTLILRPNDRRYALPIPEAIIELSELKQNTY